MPVDFEGLTPVLGVGAADVERPELRDVFDLFDVRDHAGVAQEFLVVHGHEDQVDIIADLRFKKLFQYLHIIYIYFVYLSHSCCNFEINKGDKADVQTLVLYMTDLL